MTEIPMDLAIQALQRLYKAFTGRVLPADNARELIEQARTESAK
jgi:hypothetical protein